MNDFSMTKHYNNYIEGENRIGQLREKVKNLRKSLICAEDLEEAQEQLAAAEAEYQTLAAEVDDLKCLAGTGKHRAELNQASSIQWKQQAGGMRPHFPENRVQRLNH